MAGALLSLAAVALGSGGTAAGRERRPQVGTVPTTRFALASRCFAMSSPEGKFVGGTAGGGYAATDPLDGTHFYLKPTRLGRYMLYDPRRKLMSVDGGSVVRRGKAGPAAEWAAFGSKGRFHLRATAGGRNLAIDPASGDLTLTKGPGTRFRFIPHTGCKHFPEAHVGASGKPFKGTLRNGKVLGFADYHLHITADLRAGGSVVSGRNFGRFGIQQALGRDAKVHGPDGSLDVTGNLLRTGSPTGTHDTHGWPTFKGWPVNDTYTHQQVYYQWLKRAWEAGERLVVAQTVEDEPLCKIEPIRTHSCDEMQTVALEIHRLRALQNYVDAQSGGPGKGWFRLVRNPTQARKVIQRGKLAVVIGMEASDPFGCSEQLGVPQCTKADINSGLSELRRLGLRSMFIAHWVDNAFAGAALEAGATGDFIAALQVNETGQPFQTEPCAGPGEDGDTCNSKGLTPLGRYLVHRLIAEHMLIDVDHLSEKARTTVLQIAAKAHYPLISSHTNTGGQWSPSQLRELYRGGGLATARIAPADALAKRINRLRSLQRGDGHYVGVGLGSDTGGFNALPGPPAAGQPKLSYPFNAPFCSVALTRQRTGTRIFDLNKDGVAHYGLLADLLAEMRREPGGKHAQRALFRSAESYLEMWERAYAQH